MVSYVFKIDISSALNVDVKEGLFSIKAVCLAVLLLLVLDFPNLSEDDPP